MWNISTQAATIGIAIAVTLASVTARGDIINVPGDQPTIQAGIDAAVNGDEVVLADGTYTGAGNVNCTFGGRLITVRSASGNPEACVIDCQNAADTRGFTFNTAETNAAVLSGITIQDGNIVAGGLGNGGAILISGTAAPSITNCRFVSNASPNQGGAIHSTGTGHPALTQCDFINNTSANGGAINVGSSTFLSCRFIGNNTPVAPGGQHGGAARITGAAGSGTALFVNCLFNNNYADEAGGAIFTSHPDLQLINCTLVSNVANGPPDTLLSQGGAIIQLSAFSSTTLANCIVLDNVPDQFKNTNVGPLNATYSNIDDGWPGVGNISDGAFYVDQNGADDILGTIDDDLSIRSFSPCADGGDNAAVPAGILTDLAGNPRFTDDPNSPDNGSGRAPLVDMGCFEVQPTGASSCPWDFSGDGDVGGADLGELLLHWGECGLP